MKIDKNSYNLGFERGCWFAFDHILGWINTQIEQKIDKAMLYKKVMLLRPSVIQDFYYKRKNKP